MRLWQLRAKTKGMELVENSDLYYCQSADLPPQQLSHAVFTRLGGCSPAPFASLNLSSFVGDVRENVAENQRRAYGVFGRTTETLVHVHLVHGNHVVQVTSADHGRVVPACDGLITNDVGCGLTMNYADCGSILIYDPIHHAMGLGHAGWRGAVANVGGALVRAMQTAWGSDPAQLIAVLGPCISVSHYEVDEPLISAVTETFPRWKERLLSYSAEGGQPYFNLALANHIGLYEAGVKKVALPTFCTASRTDLFFSHRAESGKTGRFGVVMVLNQKEEKNESAD